MSVYGTPCQTKEKGYYSLGQSKSDYWFLKLKPITKLLASNNKSDYECHYRCQTSYDYRCQTAHSTAVTVSVSDHWVWGYVTGITLTYRAVQVMDKWVRGYSHQTTVCGITGVRNCCHILCGITGVRNCFHIVCWITGARNCSHILKSSKQYDKPQPSPILSVWLANVCNLKILICVHTISL